jgi:hypothetical protein
LSIAHGWVALGGVRLLGENRDRAIRVLNGETETRVSSTGKLNSPTRRAPGLRGFAYA